VSAEERRTIARAPLSVRGYHGCSRVAAEAIAAGEAFISSNNAEDWLGHGIFFWEYAPYRALEWAAARTADQPAVLEATIALRDCLNLLDREHFDGLVRAYEAEVERLQRRGVRVPVNTSRGAHFLDRVVVDEYCRLTALVARPFLTVRGCFPEGVPIYEGSKILNKAHVQIAVRDARCLSDVRMVDLEQEFFGESRRA
jgi:hypothetical protein